MTENICEKLEQLDLDYKLFRQEDDDKNAESIRLVRP